MSHQSKSVLVVVACHTEIATILRMFRMVEMKQPAFSVVKNDIASDLAYVIYTYVHSRLSWSSIFCPSKAANTKHQLLHTFYRVSLTILS